MRAVAILLFMCVNVAMADEIRNKLEKQWEVLAAGYKRAHQTPPRYAVGDRRTPWFPKNWPVNDATKIVSYFYGYSYTMPPSLIDGEMIIAPWAEIDYLTGTPKVTTDRLEDIGIQGVRPLTEDEAIIFRSFPKPHQLNPSNRKQINAYYCLWIELNGVIWEKIKQPHREFHTWLQCK